ncbi:hypothetical protein LVJ94_00915 [Pendulispora rubella]|uniref:Uncharacterized protein n=1 Tax=Pendulispora rubella TaxID=2741070 RepID=A0ABZ2L4M3_9BACT
MSSTKKTAESDDFEVYLDRRRRRRRALLVAGIALFVGIVAVPYLLMRSQIIVYGTFEIFVAIDIFIAIALWRAFLTRVKDSAY